MTDSTKNPRELIAEGRKHDEAMRHAKWSLPASSVVWLQRNMTALLDGYAEALDEWDGMTRAHSHVCKELNEREQQREDSARWLEDAKSESVQLRADVLRLTETARAASENWMEACRQRDEARAERNAAIAGAYRAGVRSGQEDLPRAIQVECMRPVVEAAVAWRAGAALVDSTSLDSDLENAIDAYRASKETK